MRLQVSPDEDGDKISRIPVPVGGQQRSAKCMSWSGDLTPGLRRRRQTEKYVTDLSQLNLRFKRHSTTGGTFANRNLDLVCRTLCVFEGPRMSDRFVIVPSTFDDDQFFGWLTKIICQKLHMHARLTHNFLFFS